MNGVDRRVRLITMYGSAYVVKSAISAVVRNPVADPAGQIAKVTGSDSSPKWYSATQDKRVVVCLNHCEYVVKTVIFEFRVSGSPGAVGLDRYFAQVCVISFWLYTA